MRASKKNTDNETHKSPLRTSTSMHIALLTVGAAADPIKVKTSNKHNKGHQTNDNPAVLENLKTPGPD
ncbi:hypothetical protein CKAH01_07990 [Colletotrichum kahawae]|uniref:Uncharacterized protein n=1 Tax=Colletotrichum kahawae TaxID=34407 RepID=A0AAE0D0Y8_COLKA|nr:hypothetical protein CKAH01_07990 [Colletotrichum kahawae]